MGKQWKWRNTDAKNIITERTWVAMPREDYQKLRRALGGINPEAVPEMLEALKGLVSEFTPAGGMRLPSHSGALLGFSLATAAIAKAEK